MQHQSEGLASETLVEVNKAVLLQPPPPPPPPIQVCTFQHNLVHSLVCICTYYYDGFCGTFC
jgi:hypothetical protein